MCVLFNSVSSLCVVVCVCGAGTGAIPVQTLRWGVRRRLAPLLRTHGNAGGKEREAEGGRRGKVRASGRAISHNAMRNAVRDSLKD